MPDQAALDALDALRARWTQALEAARATPDTSPETTPGNAPENAPAPDPTPYADNLLARWQEPQRRYHTLTHLTAVLDHIDVLERELDLDQAGTPAPAPASTPTPIPAPDPDLALALVRLAAWFHDAVYAPDRSENEERSARLAERALPEAGVAPEKTAEVARLVRLTVTHAPAPDDLNGQVLCDADLAILAAPRTRTPPTRPPSARSTPSSRTTPSGRAGPRYCANSSPCHGCSERRTGRSGGRRRRAPTSRRSWSGFNPCP